MEKRVDPLKSASEKLQARRLMIVGAAVHCFVEKGYHQSGVRDIAAKAGVSLGNLYNHFKSKDEILYEITEIEAAELAEFQEALLATTDPLASLETFVRAYLDYSARPENSLMALEILSVAVRNPPIASGFARNRAMLVSALVETLKAGSETGAFGHIENVVETAKLVLDLIEGLALRCVLKNAPPDKNAKRTLWVMLQRSLQITGKTKSTDQGN